MKNNTKKDKKTDTEGKFTSRVVNIIAMRAGHRCSKPDCGKATIKAKPYPYDDGYTIDGEAAHIRGRTERSARYDKDYPVKDLNSSKNGVWLCGNCHKEVDDNPKSYSIELLEQWKKDTEMHQAITAKLTNVELTKIIDKIKLLIQELENYRSYWLALESTYSPSEVEEHAVFLGQQKQLKLQSYDKTVLTLAREVYSASRKLIGEHHPVVKALEKTLTGSLRAQKFAIDQGIDILHFLIHVISYR
ncbi:hypothetical protein [Bacillus safensis]|uniref:hypothetical protein n=1 Tax=Bacillus safensis TaxID=561879 RepID=UPI000F8956D9|nr:hypothetical protein [Bacillus safensis]MBU5206334.1 hypothetical protein [Bacillus safensis]RUK51185.1 hypothetical protein ELP67_01375 [Bacillus safensis]